MYESYEVAAGLDIHNQFIVGTLLTRHGYKDQKRFPRTTDGLLSLRTWICEHKCPVVACESTNTFWYQIHDCLSPHTKFIVGNAYDMKVLSHKKTDKLDSEMIAVLALKGMISPSHIIPRTQRDFRNLVRYRHFLVRKATDVKNRMHNVFQSELFHLSDILTDPFGKSGQKIIHGIISGKSVAEIMDAIPPDVLQRKGERIQELLSQKLSQTAIILMTSLMRMLEQLTIQIRQITSDALRFATEFYEREFSILVSVPGVGTITAITLLSEIGNFHEFSSGDKLAAWVGLVPKVYQSADHSAKCHITKRGSKQARWVLVQAAHAAARRKGSRFGNFYESKKGRMGTGKAAVALARKMITIIWHLIIKEERYVEERGGQKTVRMPVKEVTVPITCTLKEAIEIFVRAKELMSQDIDGLPFKN